MIKEEKYMKEALKQAKKAYSYNEVPVGAVIVKEGRIISRGYNKRETKQMVTKHAEIDAIEKACKKLNSWRLDGCEMYVTLEPCLMCAGAILQSRIKKVYYGADDFKGGVIESIAKVYDIGFTHKVEYEKGLLKEESEKIIKAFFKELRKRK